MPVRHPSGMNAQASLYFSGEDVSDVQWKPGHIGRCVSDYFQMPDVGTDFVRVKMNQAPVRCLKCLKIILRHPADVLPMSG